uniref:C2H2-type domain-containing protein n=1 Tax=Caenorhabditis tropicalis TaxID=1561998 RepID=A0A1I7UAM5_9PELO
MAHGSNQGIYHHHSIDEPDFTLDEQDYSQYQMGYGAEEDEMIDGMMTPRAVHQCNVCNKIFVSYKGLQQHAVIHTDQKPFRCDICSKSFRFKSNLFEHRSVHTGFTPHACPYCGKTCRLKGNLKKHLRTHVTTKEELEAAWRPFASNRRPPADIPEDAIIVRGAGGPYYTPPPRLKKKKLGLGEPSQWVDKLRNGDLLPQVELEDKIRRLEDTIFNNISLERWSNLFEIAKSIAFETHDCPICKVQFMTRLDCVTHHSIDHANSREGLEFFCEKCFRPFADEASYNQHMSYHTRVLQMIESGTIRPEPSDPDILVPTNEEFQMLFDGSLNQNLLDQPLL